MVAEGAVIRFPAAVGVERHAAHDPLELNLRYRTARQPHGCRALGLSGWAPATPDPRVSLPAQASDEPASSTGGTWGGTPAPSNTISPSRASTMIVWPARNSFHRSFSDSGSSTSRWIVPRTGRAPTDGAKHSP